MSNAVFVDSVPKAEVVDYLSLMDVALVNLGKVTLLKRLFLQRYLKQQQWRNQSFGLEGETKGIIEKYDAGVCYMPEDQNSFFKAVRK